MRKTFDSHSNGTVVLLGDLSIESSLLAVCVREFGWTFETAASLEHLKRTSAHCNVVAVLFEPQALGVSGIEAVQRVLRAAPGALPMVCHRFSENIDWPELAAGGAFHPLTVPLDPREMRQGLGFVWASKGFNAGNVIPLRRREPRRPGTARVPVKPRASVS